LSKRLEYETISELVEWIRTSMLSIPKCHVRDYFPRSPIKHRREQRFEGDP
jgi:hypothetical protein